MRITAALREQVGHRQFGPAVQAIACFWGIDPVATVRLNADLGDPHSFGRPAQLVACLDPVPSVHSSGQLRARGGITKTGTAHAPGVLVDDTWCYRNSARMNSRTANHGRLNPVPDIT